MHDCVEQTLLFVPVAVKWAAQCEFIVVKKAEKKTNVWEVIHVRIN